MRKKRGTKYYHQFVLLKSGDVYNLKTQKNLKLYNRKDGKLLLYYKDYALLKNIWLGEVLETSNSLVGFKRHDIVLVRRDLV
jgi:hypothetical protein